MKKQIIITIVSLFILSMAMFSVSALDVNYTPGETVTLPQIVSSVPYDNVGSSRTLLYCTWRLGDGENSQGEEGILMTSNNCEAYSHTASFSQDTTYYVRIDYFTISYDFGTQQWKQIAHGVANDLTVNYNINIPEPPQSFIDSLYSTIYGAVKQAICQLFPFLGMCSQ